MLKHARRVRRASLTLHTQRDAAARIAALQREQQCRVAHVVEPMTSLGFMAAHAGALAPYGASAAPPGVALLTLNSSCPELRVEVASHPRALYAEAKHKGQRATLPSC